MLAAQSQRISLSVACRGPHLPARGAADALTITSSNNASMKATGRGDAVQLGIAMQGVQKLDLEARRGGVRHRVGGDDLWIVVPLEDEPMVVSVPLDAKPGHLPALDGPQLLDVELRSGSTVRVRAVEDKRYRPEDIWRIGGVRCPQNTDEGHHIIFQLPGVGVAVLKKNPPRIAMATVALGLLEHPVTAASLTWTVAWSAVTAAELRKIRRKILRGFPLSESVLP